MLSYRQLENSNLDWNWSSSVRSTLSQVYSYSYDAVLSGSYLEILAIYEEEGHLFLGALWTLIFVCLVFWFFQELWSSFQTLTYYFLLGILDCSPYAAWKTTHFFRGNMVQSLGFPFPCFVSLWDNYPAVLPVITVLNSKFASPDLGDFQNLISSTYMLAVSFCCSFLSLRISKYLKWKSATKYNVYLNVFLFSLKF